MGVEAYFDYYDWGGLGLSLFWFVISWHNLWNEFDAAMDEDENS